MAAMGKPETNVGALCRELGITRSTSIRAPLSLDWEARGDATRGGFSDIKRRYLRGGYGEIKPQHYVRDGGSRRSEEFPMKKFSTDCAPICS